MNARDLRELKAAAARLREANAMLRAALDYTPPDPPSHHWRWEKARVTMRMELLRIARVGRPA